VAKGRVTLESFDDRIVEFPRIDDRLQTQPHRYVNLSAKTPACPPFQWNLLLRVDTETGTTTEWDSGTKHFNEVVFASAEGGEPEQGYYVTFRTDVETLESDWVVLDAGDIASGPIATVELPFRVPNGLHGNWYGASTF
jgi:carotenoid cleavage dioxygenase